MRFKKRIGENIKMNFPAINVYKSFLLILLIFFLVGMVAVEMYPIDLVTIANSEEVNIQDELIEILFKLSMLSISVYFILVFFDLVLKYNGAYKKSWLFAFIFLNIVASIFYYFSIIMRRKNI